MTVSIGVATWAGDADFESLLRRADAAMSEAKRQGRNRIAVGDPVSRAPDAATAD
jgi:diguanylate cyclase